MKCSTMMTSFDDFKIRLGKVEKKRLHLARGYSAYVSDDGLIVFTAKRQKTDKPVRAMIGTLVAFVLFKALVLGAVGPEAYLERVERLTGQSVFGQLGALVLSVDPATQMIVDLAEGLLQ
jgi:hypothetical protein